MSSLLSRFANLKALVALAAAISLLLSGLAPAFAQAPPSDAPPPAFTRQKLEQLASPIALYPDSLLTQIMMAATYPLDVVQAARWRRANPGLRGEALQAALEGQTWDESVKALTAFPDVLRMLDEHLEWTEQLGEAFIAAPDALMAAVQDLRRRAEAAGHLKSDNRYRVQRYTGGSYGPQGYYVIEPVDPDVIYIPTYDPIVFGAWPYPDYPPYYWYPRDRARDTVIWFGTAIVVGTALWAAWDWNRRRVSIDRRRFTRFNRGARPITNWQFNPERRRGAPFRTPGLSNRFKAGTPAKGARPLPGRIPPRIAPAPGQFGGRGKQPPTGARTPTVLPKATIPPKAGQPKAPVIRNLPPRQITRPPSRGVVRRAIPTRPVRPAPTVRRAAPINRPPVARPQVRIQRAAPPPRARPAAAPRGRAGGGGGGGGGAGRGKRR